MNKKLIFTFLLVLSLSNLTKALTSFPTAGKTRIIVVGTVHVPTYNFDSDTLLSILNNIRPDVILVESDSSYLTRDFQLKEDIKYSFPETSAITNYLQTNRVQLRPYDINGRDFFLNDRERKRNERSFFNDIEYLSMNDKLNSDAINILNKILAMMSTSREMAFERSTYINSPEGSKKIDTINYYSYTGLSQLINSTPELSQYRSYWDEENNYWEKRNNVMLENIISYAKFFEGNTIVVFCGFAHKNLLKNGLLKNADEGNFEVMEFSEF